MLIWIESASSMRRRIVAVHGRVVDAGLAQLFLQPLHGLIGFHLHGVLHLHLQDQVAAAAQIQAQIDVLLNVGFQFVQRLGQPDDPVHADEQHHQNRQSLSTSLSCSYQSA